MTLSIDKCHSGLRTFKRCVTGVHIFTLTYLKDKNNKWYCETGLTVIFFRTPRQRRDISKEWYENLSVFVILYSPSKLAKRIWLGRSPNTTAKQYHSPLANITVAPSLRRVPQICCFLFCKVKFTKKCGLFCNFRV